MHSACSGVARKLIKCLFSPDPAKDKKLTAFRTQNLDEGLRQIRVPSEFQRKARPLDTGSYKAEEYRNIFLFYFPLVIEYVFVSSTMRLVAKFYINVPYFVNFPRQM